VRVRAGKSPVLFTRTEPVYEFGFLREMGPPMAQLLSQMGIGPRDFLGLNRTLRFCEGIIAPGQSVVVAGVARWEPSATGEMRSMGYRDAPEQLVLEAAGQGALVVADADVLAS
jgi:hypothetical protein